MVEKLANFITIAGWLLVVMFYVVLELFGVLFEGTMILISIMGGLAWLGIAIFLVWMIFYYPILFIIKLLRSK